MGVVVGVLRVHWLLLQSLAHVAGILSTEAGNGDTGAGAAKTQRDRGSFPLLLHHQCVAQSVLSGEGRVCVPDTKSWEMFDG